MKTLTRSKLFIGDMERESSTLIPGNDEIALPSIQEDETSKSGVYITEQIIYIKILGYITENTYSEIMPELIDIIANGTSADICVFIDSTGGAVRPALSIANTLKAMKNKIITIAMNECASAACVLFAVGDERYMLSGTKFMMHKIKASIGDVFLNDIEYRKLGTSLRNLEKEYKELISKGSQMPKEKFDEIFSSEKDTFFSDKEVLKYRLATKVFKSFSELEL